MFMVLIETTQCPFLGRHDFMHFHSRSYQTLLPQPDDCLFGKLTPLNIHDDPIGSTTTYIRTCEASDVAYHLVDDGQAVFLDHTPQLYSRKSARSMDLPSFPPVANRSL